MWKQYNFTKLFKGVLSITKANPPIKLGLIDGQSLLQRLRCPDLLLILVPNMGQSSKVMFPTFPIMQPSSVFYRPSEPAEC